MTFDPMIGIIVAGIAFGVLFTWDNVKRWPDRKDDEDGNAVEGVGFVLLCYTMIGVSILALWAAYQFIIGFPL